MLIRALPSLLMLLLLAITTQSVFCQDLDLLRLRRFEDVSQTAWRDQIYYFPQFQEGTIIYQTGFKLSQTLNLNYNIYYERMDFLGEAGDTLGIGSDKEIKLIEIGSHLFFHDYKSGYYEILTTSSVSLAMQPKLSLVKTEGNCGSVPWSIETRGAVMDCDRLYFKHMSFFFIDVKDQILKADRVSILKLFRENKSDIQAYLIENPVDFTKQEDVIRLTNYCYQFDVPRSSGDGAEISQTNTLVKLDAGKAFPTDNPENLYQFPEFREAKITWWSNKSSDYFPKMNYNLFTGRMDVINPSPDTVEFKDSRDAKILNLDGHIFYQDFGKGYMEIILQGPLALAVRNRFTLVNDRKVLEEAGMTDQANASSVSNGKTVVNYDRVYKLEKTYFFLNNKNHVFDANKLSLFRSFPIHREEIIDFIKTNSISFEKEEDLMSLVTFCNQLLVKR